MKLIDLLRIGIARSPDGCAIEHGDKSVTYCELEESVGSLTTRLKSLDVKPGSRVALLWDNTIEYVELFFAVIAAGYVVVPLDTSLKPAAWKFIFDDCRPVALLIGAKFARFLPQLVDEQSSVGFVLSDRAVSLQLDRIDTAVLSDALKTEQAELGHESSVNIEGFVPPDSLTHQNLPDLSDDLAAIFYTSGSTGQSKGVMLSHRNLVSNTVATVEYLKLTASDSIIQILPFYYIYGNSLLLTHMLAGGRVVIDNRFAFPQAVLDTMIASEVTGLSGVPSNFMILLNNTNFCGDKLPHLRYLTQAGGAMAPEVTRRLMAAFPDREICIMYGQTEASPRVTYLPPEMLSKKLGSIGINVPGVTIELLDQVGKPVPTGEVGEIVISGDNVMLGYFNSPEEQGQVLKDGYLYSGDLARCDEDGYFYVVSRKKEIIKVGGNRVSAKEVEERILECPKVQEVAVVSVSDDILGEAIKAVVVLRYGETADQKEIQGHCRASLAAHKVPGSVEFVAELPKLQSGKVNKRALISQS